MAAARNRTGRRGRNNRVLIHAGVLLAALCSAEGLAQRGAIARSTIVVDGSSTVGPLVKALAVRYMDDNPRVNITVSESGSGNGVKSLINSSCDIASMSRFMKLTEFEAALGQDVMPTAHVIAIDAIAVIVNPANPVTGLSIAQLRDIYTGRVSNWNQVGGPDSRIVRISRDANSGTFEAFSELVLEGEHIAASTEIVGSAGAMRQRVQGTPAAIGFDGLGFVDRTLKAVSVDGVAPDPAAAKSGEYPLARPLYLFTNGCPRPGSHLFRYIRLPVTPEGEAIIRSIGFIPLTEYAHPASYDSGDAE